MRPSILFSLFSDASTLSGVGSKVHTILEKLLGYTRVRDLVFHLPSSYIDRRASPDILHAPEGEIATLTVTVDQHVPPPPRSRRPYRVVCSNPSGFLTLTFFTPRVDYLTRTLPLGAQRVISGRVERYQNTVQMPHPDYMVPAEKREDIPDLEPVYPLTAGITNKQLRKIILAALAKIPDLPEWIDEAFLKKQGWLAWKAALHVLHTPTTDTLMAKNARERLIYDEVLAHQVALQLIRQRLQRAKGTVLQGDGHLRQKALDTLPFQLTDGQRTVGREIEDDLASGQRMMRLLQGDVGSGKTVVCLLAMLCAVECGKQAAFMVPTTILSRQHYRWIASMAEQIGIRVALLTGAEKGAQRKNILQDVESGEIDILVGTHALFQASVEFRDLGLVVIDEQHRFGVHQRLALTSKGDAHVLLMTATPIPRSLTMTLFGDMDCSRLTEKPANRLPIDTRVMPLSKLPQVVEGLHRTIAKGARVYWICPLVEESEVSDLAAVEERYRAFVQEFDGRVGMVHGRMKADERDVVMGKFASGDYDVLVATTVVEVGVDVPEATVIVIEHAERFGLSQLHQLRGRVGRSDKPSTCILLYADGLTESGHQRLAIMRETNDGFRIAEEDLHIRGGGDVLGTRQSGLPAFHFADLYRDRELLRIAHDDAKLALHQDAALQTERGKALRVLLYLFEYDALVGNVRSG